MTSKSNKRFTPYTRQKEFSNTFNVLNNTLMCICCGHSVSWEHKVSITTHVNSKTHKKNKQNYNAAAQNNQFQTLEDSFSVMESKKAMVKDLVEAFVKANVPLEKVNALQPFFRKYCKEGGSVPQADTLRWQYLPEIHQQYINELKENFQDKPVAIIIDETTDSRARSVVNILYNYRKNTKLVVVDFLNFVNNTTIGQLIVKTLTEWAIPFDRPRLLVSDSAPYIKKSYREILKPILSQLVYLPCLAHILNLISQAWVSILQIGLIKTLLANIKKTFVYAKARRTRYIKFLARNGIEKPTNIPLYTDTRWNSWFKMALYVNDYYQHIRNFFLEEHLKDSNKTIETLSAFFNDPSNNGCAQIYLYFIKIYAQQFINDLNFFQQECLPLFPYIEGRLNQLENHINSGIRLENLDGSLISFIQNLNFDPESFLPIFRSTYDAASKKFNDHILNHSCCSLFKATQIFDPKFINLTSAKNIFFYSTSIYEFSDPSYELIQEWAVYCNLDPFSVEYSNLEEFWQKTSHILPCLSQIALDYIWLPLSSCSVECSFSVYNNILNEDRENLSQESLRMLNILYYNLSEFSV